MLTPCLGLDDVKAAVFFGTAFAQCFLLIKKVIFLFSEGVGDVNTTAVFGPVTVVFFAR